MWINHICPKSMSSSQNPNDGHEKHWQLSEKMWQTRCRRKKRELTRWENTPVPTTWHFPHGLHSRCQAATTRLLPRKHSTWADRPVVRALFRALIITQPANPSQENTHTHNIHHILFTPSKTSLAVRPRNTQWCQFCSLLQWITHVRACTGGGAERLVTDYPGST